MRMFHRAKYSEREKIARVIKGILEQEPHILFAFIYGSFLDSEVFRDIDVGILLRNDDATAFTTLELSLSSRIENALSGTIPVEVRVINRAPLSLQFAVIRGKLLFSRADRILEEFMIDTARQYLDFAPLRKHYIREAMIS